LLKRFAIFAQVRPAPFCFWRCVVSFAKLSLKGRALKLLAQREHSRLELQRKLAAHVEEGDDLNAVLDELEQRGFISVERVVESVLRSKAGRYGAARLVHDLRSKGLDDETVRRRASSCAAASCSVRASCGASALAACPSTSRKRPGSCASGFARLFGSVASRVLRDAPYSPAPDSEDED
jgi:regulatory protein